MNYDNSDIGDNDTDFGDNNSYNSDDDGCSYSYILLPTLQVSKTSSSQMTSNTSLSATAIFALHPLIVVMAVIVEMVVIAVTLNYDNKYIVCLIIY